MRFTDAFPGSAEPKRPEDPVPAFAHRLADARHLRIEREVIAVILIALFFTLAIVALRLTLHASEVRHAIR
jgi:hypothetical protein